MQENLETTWTHDIPPGRVDLLIDRIRSCDGKTHDSTVLVWRQAQALVAEIDRLYAALATAEAQVRAVVPLGDLSGVAMWTAVDALYRERLAEEVMRLRTAIRQHRDEHGDDRCHADEAEARDALSTAIVARGRDTLEARKEQP